jgi:hypothetical protein
MKKMTEHPLVVMELKNPSDENGYCELLIGNK